MMRASRKPSEASPQRIASLAKLPVFLDLADKRAVVAGGTSAAAWKAELLAAAGARVAVYAVDMCTEMQALIERQSAQGHIAHVSAGWSIDALAEASVAIADIEDEDEAAAFVAAARSAGVPANVIDKPAYCQFQFGSIVNRSPVVIGISTDGAAPILGQAIRRRIESLLPASLAGWAALAKDIRDAVCARLSPGPQRRAFWERFVDRAFGPAPDAADREATAALIDDVTRDTSGHGGRVTLVGAGPGDPELLTLKAVRALQAADVILFDDLVSDEVLELARREAKRMLVGKRGGRESCRQDDINALMLKLARQGKHVVRLKSGDPMVFGRAGEEIAALRAAGIPVSVVAGITAASAMAAEMGVSLTHRDTAHSVRLVTGHAKSGQLPADLDWHGLADPETTLVFYMGGRTASAIGTRLMSEGLAPATPVVIHVAVSRADQELRRTSLAELAAGGAELFDGRPTLIAVGNVFKGVMESLSSDCDADMRVASAW